MADGCTADASTHRFPPLFPGRAGNSTWYMRFPFIMVGWMICTSVPICPDSRKYTTEPLVKTWSYPRGASVSALGVLLVVENVEIAR